MQRLATRLLLLLLAAAARAVTVVESHGGARAGVPRLVVPEDWVRDREGRFLFLPLSVPEDVLGQCKLLTSGDQILVVVTELPQDQPESDALRKFRLLLKALKAEAGHSEHALQERLTEWLATEEDDEVRAHVQEALTSMSVVHAAKTSPALQVVVPLGLMQLRGSEVQAPQLRPAAAQHMLVGTENKQGKRRRAHHTGIVKESFSVDIPYPVEPDAIFALLRSPTKILVAMPLVRSSLGAQGISTGGVPYVRIPVFGREEQLLAGSTEKKLGNLAPGLDLHALSAAADGFFVALS